MLFNRCEGYILALLLVSFALQNLSVHADHHQVVTLVERRLMGGNSVKEAQENDEFVKKEYSVAGISGIVGGSNKAKIGGRKMGMKLKQEDGEMASRLSTGDAQELNVEADKNASKEGPQDFLDNQGQTDTLKTMTINRGRSLQNQVSHANTNNIVLNEDQSEEWRKVLAEADKRVAEMMNRDYTGRKNPRRGKPPINNREPRN